MFRIVLCAHCRFKHIPQQRIAGGVLNSDVLVSESQSSWRSRQAFTRSVAERGLSISLYLHSNDHVLSFNMLVDAGKRRP